MKKLILIFALLIPVFFLQISTCAAFTQKEDTTAVADDIQFTEIGSPADSAAAPKVTGSAKKDTVKAVASVMKSSVSQEKEQTLWDTFLQGLVGGFIAFLMPCIFPMVPLTVSYFTKRAGSKAKGIGQALIYGASIIIIYVAFGLFITLVFGSTKLNELSSSGTFNFVFFILLVVFAISFFGAFEITLPSSFVNKIDQKADNSKGFGGIFFMAASLALVSFSCTGPIIGTLLVQASSKGDILAPAIGMFGFALALAIPFTLSAVFPGFMPKSGGWLNSVKVCLGFLELALALKFLSAADLVWHWDLFDREVFLVLWIVIFTLLGLYILGKIKFSHDSDVPYVSVPRLFIAIFSFAFAMYLVPGLWGAPVNILSGIAPPLNTQDFILGGSTTSAPASASSSDFPATVKYNDVLHPPRGFNAFFDLDEGMAYAKKTGKPILIDFTGHACVNCRKMEDLIWVNPEVGSLIKDKYVLIQLYVDERSVKMPPEKVHQSKILRTITDDLGRWNGDFQATNYNSNSQPFYVLTDQSLVPLVSPQGAIFDAKEYAAYLQSGLDKFNASKK
jgi:thiol:disulfide interchange protein